MRNDYPDVPLYKSEEIPMLRRAINRRHCIILFRRLWKHDRFRHLPAGSKLLYGIVLSKLATGDVIHRKGKPGGIKLTVKRRQELLGCSNKSALMFLNVLSESGIVDTDNGKGKGFKGQPDLIIPKFGTDISGTPAAVIPISLFSRREFVKLPCGVKLLYGIVFANMVNERGCEDPLGNYGMHRSKMKIKEYYGGASSTYKKNLRHLVKHGLIAISRLDVFEDDTNVEKMIYVRRLVEE